MNKVLTGILSIVPMILFVIYIMLLAMTGDEQMGLVCILFTVLGIVTLLDTVLFIIYACKQTQWPTEKKVVWGIVLYSFSFLVFPIFWWLYIRKE